LDSALQISNVPEVVDATVAANFLAVMKYVEIGTGTINLATVPVSAPLIGGSYDSGNLVDDDFVGSATAATGIHAFAPVRDIWRIAIPHKSVPVIDIALADYAKMRQDLRAILRTPTGINGAGAIDYRNGTGIYSHTAIDTHFASMFTGGLQIKNAVTGVVEDIPETADILGLKAFRDNKNNFEYKPWFASAGPKYPILNAVGVAYEFSTPARALEYDDVANVGINTVINDPDFGIVPNDKDTLLSHENVSELMVYMLRNIKILAKSEQFNPNDIDTWKAIHRKITPFLDGLVTGRAIWEGYLYQGDQDIDFIEDAVVNTPEGIDAGGYTANIYVKPKVALKYIGINIVVTNSGVNLTELAEQLVS